MAQVETNSTLLVVVVAHGEVNLLGRMANPVRVHTTVTAFKRSGLVRIVSTFFPYSLIAFVAVF